MGGNCKRELNMAEFSIVLAEELGVSGRDLAGRWNADPECAGIGVMRVNAGRTRGMTFGMDPVVAVALVTSVVGSLAANAMCGAIKKAFEKLFPEWNEVDIQLIPRKDGGNDTYIIIKPGRKS